MGAADEGDPLVRPVGQLVGFDHSGGKIAEHAVALYARVGERLHVIAGDAIKRSDAIAIFGRFFNDAGVIVCRAFVEPHVPFVLTAQVSAQMGGHGLAGTEIVQVSLMQIGLQMFHIQRFVAAFVFFQLLDQQRLARLRRMGFAEHQAGKVTVGHLLE